MTIAIAPSIPSDGYLYYFSNFFTIRRMPGRADSFFCQFIMRPLHVKAQPARKPAARSPCQSRTLHSVL